MPLASDQYGHQKIEPFLWGLLPGSEIVLGQWARKLDVSPRNAFGLVANVGEDCAFAFSLYGSNASMPPDWEAPQEVQWLDETGVADKLRALRQDQSARRIPRDTGQSA
jgi:serine/threonine-protein kinase HipA